MGRIFSMITAIAVFMTALAGSGIYLLTLVSVNSANNDAMYALSKGASQNITAHTALLSTFLHNIAQSPELIDALNQSDLASAKAIIEQRSVALPGLLVIRLLRPDDQEPDRSIVPHMGYADLDLVKNTFQAAQKPLVQGEQGENRHLAITQGVLQDGKVIAVILASIDFNSLQQSFNTLTDSRLYLELRQADYALFSHGDSALKTSGKSRSFNVKDTPWTANYWHSDTLDFSLATLVLSIILIPSFVSGLACYVGRRKLEVLLIHDQRSVLKATKDLMMGKAKGNYPIKLKEMNHFISTIIQFKRVLENENKDTDSENTTHQSDEFDGFFDQSLGSDSPSSEYAGFEIQDIDSADIGSAISLPECANYNNDTKPKLANPFKLSETLPAADNPRHLVESASLTDVIFRAYDIRGIVDQELTQDIVYDIGRAIGSEAFDKGISTIVAAKDGRISSPALSKVLADGILSTGTNILDIGTVPTPVLYFVAHHHDSHTGVMLTGSHNPANYNGLKIVIAGETLAGDKIQNIRQRIEDNNLQSNAPGTLTENSMFTNEYIGMIADDIRIARPMKVIVDAGNGVAGQLAPILLKTLGCEVIELFCDIDGTFPNHHPDTSKPENYAALIDAMEHYQADVGIAFDGDGDRLGVVDSSGKIIWPDRQMMLFSKSILARKPGAEIIYDVKCSRHLAEQIKKQGGRPTIWKTGHSYMKAKVKQSAAIFAGEMSGHLFFNDRWPGFDDGLYAAARLIEILSEDSRRSAEVFTDFPDSFNTPELSIEVAEGENFTIMNRLLKNPNFPGGQITDIDGLRVDFTDGFGLVRASNTTPSLVVRFEGDTPEALARIQNQFRQLILEINPQLTLPF
ncbi:MAG: phosphomannomutase/phosphoglucomutase [Methyloprofundus sp.]|nr:phosphomannomutase/phosphoglucomutase [Methyloprofundus sp.]MBW6453666.1 phosphomannomutase/phosphoglucomutase [Methyloprofundus sp.]